ncbi:MAG: heme exporter protein CcmB [Rickettsia endosymbiont of Ecitomorpha arachnoides]|nr:heme exporter protein CcmB [Rickettsia endosymbiont of Sceptobius lativentris]MCC8461624.1 heme exporter protein CcmB [Rickettsia endosymbiont of Ecitomorpha arachnoides]
MSNLFLLIKREFIVQNRINNMIKYLVIFFLFCLISTVLINSQKDITKFGLIFSVICLLISLIGFSSIIFKTDLEDGSLELLLSIISYEKIILAKFFAIFISSTVGLVFVLPIIYVFFDQTLLEIIFFFISVWMMLVLSSSLVVLSGSVQCYFKKNANFVGTFIMPLLIPNIIMTGLILQDNNLQLIFIMIGINLVFLPISFFLSSYLIKNIYNIT